jgi:hypothetical protein
MVQVASSNLASMGFLSLRNAAQYGFKQTEKVGKAS